MELIVKKNSCKKHSFAASKNLTEKEPESNVVSRQDNPYHWSRAPQQLYHQTLWIFHHFVGMPDQN